MMAEPCRLYILNMSSPTNTNLDGDLMTTHGEQRIMNNERDGSVSRVLEGELVVLGEQPVETDAQTVVATVGELLDDPVVLAGDPLALDDPLDIGTSPEEVAMVVGVDPAMFATSARVSEDEAVLSPSTSSPLKSVTGTPVTPHRDFLSLDSSPGVSGRENAGTSRDDVEIEVGVKSRKVVGRKLAVVEDDIETQSSMSVSLDEGALTTTASSSRAVSKGIKRGRGSRKNKDRNYEERSEEESSSEDRKGKKKGNKRRAVKKDTPPEEVLSDGKCGEPMGLVELALESLSSSVLGGNIIEWSNRIEEIRSKSRNIHGRLSGEMKRILTKIKDGTTLLIARAEATGDSEYLRMRNSELNSRVLDAERENVRLKEQLKKLSLGPSPPRRKRKVDNVDVGMDQVQSKSVDLSPRKEIEVATSMSREEFPPLAQRPPRNAMMGGKSGWKMPSLPALPTFSTMVCDSEGTETGAEAYFTQHIDFLIAARDLERKRKVNQGRTQAGHLEGRSGDRKDKDEIRSGETRVEARKVGPRVISDVQIAPPYRVRLEEEVTPPVISGSEPEWKVASGGRRRRRGGNVNDTHLPPLSPFPASRRNPPVVTRDMDGGIIGDRARRGPPSGQLPRVRPPRPPVSSAVTITGKVEGFSYASALKSARENINLEALGIQSSRVRKAINGGLLIEVSGEGSKAKAEELMVRLRNVLKDSAAVSCPIKKRELRIVGFDESVTSEEIVEVLSKLGDCSMADIKTGPIRTMSNGLGMAWVQLPVASAVKVADEGRIRIGWTVARVELLKARPLQCYRCWSFGHVQSTCRSVIDRRGACFRCGQQGHVVSTCRNPAHCAVCHDLGLEASHRLGGPQCAAQLRQDALLADRRPLMTVGNV